MKKYRIPAILLGGSVLIWLFYGTADIEIVRWSEAQRHTWLRPLSAFITEFGVVTGWLVGSLLLGLFAHYRLHDRALMRKARFFFVSVAVTGLAVLPLKWLFGKARPTKLIDENLYGFDWFVSPLDYGMHSFPSGHTTTAFSVATALALIFPRFGVWFYVGAVLVGLSRIGVLYHYPGDVVAGAMLGTILTLLLYNVDTISFKRHP